MTTATKEGKMGQNRETTPKLAKERKAWAQGKTTSETVRRAESIAGIRAELRRAGIL